MAPLASGRAATQRVAASSKAVADSAPSKATTASTHTDPPPSSELTTVESPRHPAKAAAMASALLCSAKGIAHSNTPKVSAYTSTRPSPSTAGPSGRGTSRGTRSASTSRSSNGAVALGSACSHISHSRALPPSSSTLRTNGVPKL